MSSSIEAAVLSRTVADLEAVVGLGCGAGATCRALPASQVAKLYGFTEKLLTTKIDNMSVAEAQGAPDPELKKIRKDLVGRSNILLDALEKLKDRSEGVKGSGTEDDATGGRSAVGISLEEGDELQLAVTLDDFTGLAVHASKLISQPDLDLAGSYQPQVQFLLTNGFITDLPRSGVVARHDATPYSSACTRHDGRGSGKELRTVHTHAAAAIALANQCPMMLNALYLFISFTANSFHFSVVRVGGSVVRFVLSRQVQVTTRGSTSALSAAAESLVPQIVRSLKEVRGGEEALLINGIVLASAGPRTAAMYPHLRDALAAAFPRASVLAPAMVAQSYPGGMETNCVDGKVIRPDFIAYGAAVLAMSMQTTVPHHVTITIEGEPLSCVVGVRSRAMPGQTYLPGSKSASGVSMFNALLTAMPFFLPSAALPTDGVIEITKTLALMACSGTDTAVHSTNPARPRPTDDLFLEVVQIDLGWGNGGSGSNGGGWNDGVLQSAIAHKSPSPAVIPKIGGLPMAGQATTESLDGFLEGGCLSSLRGPLSYRLIGRFPIPQLFSADCASSEEPSALQMVTVRLSLAADRHVAVSLKAVSLMVDEQQGHHHTISKWDVEASCDLDNSVYSPAPIGLSVADPSESVYFFSDTEQADELKRQGNAQLKADEGGTEMSFVERAISDYSLALQWDPLNGVLYSNRCAARLKMCSLRRLQPDSVREAEIMLQQALTDAQACAQLRPKWSKGHSRLGEVLFRQNKLESALDAYNMAYACEMVEQNIPPNAPVPPYGAEVSKSNSSILRALREVQGAWDLQVATRAAQEAEEMLRAQASGEQTGSGVYGKKKKRTEANTSSKCIVS